MQAIHKEKILELRAKGYSYSKIRDELGCSKGTIAFHCGKGQKDKYTKNRKRFRKNNPLANKIYAFSYRLNTLGDNNSPTKYFNLRHLVYHRILRFQGPRSQKAKAKDMTFSVDDFLAKFGENPKCSLTGRNIDLLDSRSYHLDHIVPVSNGGSSELDNCQILCKEANQAKHNLSQENFIKLCEEVVKHNKTKKKKKSK